ncbi:hypothetical protein D3C78_1583500 [compost metagenome]
MCATVTAGVALDHCVRVNHLELLAMGQHADLVAWDHRHHREGRACGLPALGTATGMVVQRLCVDGDLDLVGRAQALQGASGETGLLRLNTLVD